MPFPQLTAFHANDVSGASSPPCAETGVADKEAAGPTEFAMHLASRCLQLQHAGQCRRGFRFPPALARDHRPGVAAEAGIVVPAAARPAAWREAIPCR
jgi:hypothetical protein